MLSKTKKIMVAVIAAVIMGAVAAPIVMADLVYLGQKDGWTLFDKVRVKSYLEVGGWLGTMVPPAGKGKGIHYVAQMGDAYLDRDLPRTSAMNFLREVVMTSPGFRKRFEHHEARAIASGKSTYTKSIVQAVKFDSVGLPFTDHFAIMLRTDVIDGKPKSSFLVWGLGAIVDKRNPAGLGPQYDEIAAHFGLKGADLIRWTCHMEKEGLAKPYWVLISERPETSKFSHEAVRIPAAQRRAAWHRATRKLHAAGDGYSVSELYAKL